MAMLEPVAQEIGQRTRLARELVRLVRKREADTSVRDATCAEMKGLLFVQLYGIHEHVVRSVVSCLVEAVAASGLGIARLRRELVALAVEKEFDAIRQSSSESEKVWTRAVGLFRKVECNEVAQVRPDAAPHDGSHFRASQLEFIWEMFGMPGCALVEAKSRGYLDEIVEKRNQIAHGREAAADVGARFTCDEMEKRVGVVEQNSLHLVGCVRAFLGNAGPRFERG